MEPAGEVYRVAEPGKGTGILHIAQQYAPADAEFKPTKGRRERDVAGVDVGGDRSASAVVWVNAKLHVGAAIYHGDSGVLECVEQVRELAASYSLREVVFDPWRFGQAKSASASASACACWPSPSPTFA